MLEEKYINLNGREFRYLEREGVGCKLLFLHGLSDSADQFLPIASRLQEDWHLLALDQRGHGGSWQPKLGYTPMDYVQDIKDFIDALTISSLNIFGHSMGGRNAFIFAAQFPECIQSLILGDIGPDKNLDDVKGTIDFFNNLPKSFQTPAKARDHLENRKPGYSVENLDILMKNLTEDANGNLVWRYSKDACIQSVTDSRSRDWWEYLPRIQCPVLLLHVEGSTELSFAVAERMVQEIPTVNYRTVPDSGHNFQFENPDFATSEIHQFLKPAN